MWLQDGHETMGVGITPSRGRTHALMKAEADQRGWVLLTDGEEVGPVRMGVARTPENGLVVLLQDEDEIHLTPTMLRTMIDLMDQGIEPADPVMELTVPQVRNWLSANDREHPLKRARRVKEWRTAAGWLGRDVGAVETPVHVTFVFKRRSSRRWDVENLAPTAKAIMDGLRDAGVLPEDDTTHIPVVTFRSAVGPPSVDVIMERC
jgi:crossover junction endodeoxyribonuclease RusA